MTDIIAIDPTVQHLSGCPACMDADSYQMLLVVIADLVAFRESEPQRPRAHMLQESIKRLSWLLRRVEQEVTP